MRESLLKVVDEVLMVLDADGESDEVIVDAELLSL